LRYRHLYILLLLLILSLRITSQSALNNRIFYKTEYPIENEEQTDILFFTDSNVYQLKICSFDISYCFKYSKDSFIRNKGKEVKKLFKKYDFNLDSLLSMQYKSVIYDYYIEQYISGFGVVLYVKESSYKEKTTFLIEENHLCQLYYNHDNKLSNVSCYKEFTNKRIIRKLFKL